jgi:apolipoprotein N-acyltransferase
LFGSADFGKYAKEAGDRAERIEFKNEAFLMLPDGTVRGPAVKNRLVPFAEYMPLAEYVAWPRWLVARQLHGIAGADPELIELRDGIRLGVSICWENFFTDLTRTLVDHGAAVIVQLSNDGDFGASAEPAQHNAASVLRAVEYGRPIVLASSNGPSRVIDEYGRITARLDAIGVPGWVVAVVSRPAQTTTYHRWSLAWMWLAAVAAAALLALDLSRYLKARRQR